jgi:hypothetical protein
MCNGGGGEVQGVTADDKLILACSVSSPASENSRGCPGSAERSRLSKFEKPTACQIVRAKTGTTTPHSKLPSSTPAVQPQLRPLLSSTLSHDQDTLGRSTGRQNPELLRFLAEGGTKRRQDRPRQPAGQLPKRRKRLLRWRHHPLRVGLGLVLPFLPFLQGRRFLPGRESLVLGGDGSDRCSVGQA